MSLRGRIALLAGAAVAVAVVVVASASFWVTRNQLVGQIDAMLRQRAAHVGGSLEIPPIGPFEGPRVVAQLVRPDGTTARLPREEIVLPVDEVDLEVASGASGQVIRSVSVSGERARMITTPVPGAAVQLAVSLEEVEQALRAIAGRSSVAGLIGVAAAALAGWLVAGAALRPVERLTEAAEQVAVTLDLPAPIAVERDDELGRLASSFNAMIAALQASRAQQAQLVQDASHELRTPLTSLRTNLEVLARADDMDAGERSRLLSDVNDEMAELSDLVGEVVELAGEGSSEDPVTEVRLDEIASKVAARAGRRTGRHIDVSVEPSVVQGRARAIERAMSNLLDNAAKFSPEEAPIEVSVSGTTMVVRDHGPGLEEDERERVFDRFYRPRSSRPMPGSGLGLSIVRAVAEQHGGSARLEPAEGGGTRAVIDLSSTP